MPYNNTLFVPRAKYQTIVPMFLGQVALTTSPSVIYLAPVQALTAIRDIVVVNTTGSTATFNLYIVSPVTTASASNAIYYTYSLTAGQTLHWTGEQILAGLWTLQGNASTTGLTVTVSGGMYI
jgi:hypothetical protein